MRWRSFCFYWVSFVSVPHNLAEGVRLNLLILLSWCNMKGFMFPLIATKAPAGPLLRWSYDRLDLRCRAVRERCRSTLPLTLPLTRGRRCFLIRALFLPRVAPFILITFLGYTSSFVLLPRLIGACPCPSSPTVPVGPLPAFQHRVPGVRCFIGSVGIFTRAAGLLLMLGLDKQVGAGSMAPR